MKKIFFLLTVFLTMAVCLYANGTTVFKSASKKVEYSLQKGIYYNMTVSDTKEKNVQNGIVYNKGSKARMDFNNISTIIDGDIMYIYTPSNKSAVKMSVQQETGRELDSFDSTKIPENAVFIKTVKKNGYPCQLVKSEEDGIDTEYYLTDEFGFPTCVKTSEGNEINMTNFKYGVKDSQFNLPAGTKINDMSGLFSQTGNKKSKIMSDSVKNTANETVVSGAKEAKDEIVSEQKNSIKEETKSKTKEAVNKLFGF